MQESDWRTLSLSLSLSLSTKSAIERVVVLLMVLMSVIGVTGLTTETKEEMIIDYEESNVNNYIEGIMQSGEGDDRRHLSWGVSDAISNILRMYEVTGDETYLTKSAEYIEEIIKQRDIERGVNSFIDSVGDEQSLELWRSIDMTEYYYWYKDERVIEGELKTWDWLKYDDWIKYWPNIDKEKFGYPYLVCNGMIIKPISEFCLVVDRENKWTELGSGLSKINRDTLLSVINQVLDYYNTTYDVNHYYWNTNNMWDIKAFSTDTFQTPDIQRAVPPMNYQFIIGQVLTIMYEITGENRYRTKAEEMGQYMKSFLDDTTKNDCYLWNYHCKEYNSGCRAEDISHAVLEIEFAYRLNKIGLSVFTDADLEKFANTFVRVVFTGNDMSYYTGETEDEKLMPMDGIYELYPLVNGVYTNNDSYFGTYFPINLARSRGVMWGILTEYEPRVYEIGYNICGKFSYNGIACLLKYYEEYRPAKIELSKPSITVNTYDEIDIRVDSIKMLGNFRYAVYQENGDTFTKGGIAVKDVEDHIIQVNDLRTKSAEDIVFKYWSDNGGILGPSKEYVIPVVGETLYVSHRDEIPVLKIEDIRVEVTKVPIPDPQPDGYEYQSIPGCTIELHYFEGEVDTGVTNSMGVVDWNDNIISSTYLLKVVAYKDGYFPDTSYIEPYMWSTIQEAMGPSSSNHMIMYYDTIRDTTMVNMVYTDGERIISCTSEDYGETWFTVSMGNGSNPSITEIVETGCALIWKYGAGWAYSFRTSPWTPIDTNSFDVINSVMPSIISDPGSDTMIWLTGLCESQLYNGNYGIVYSQFKYYRWDTFSQTVLINTTGELNEENYLAIPQANPSVGAKDWSGVYAPMFAFEDKNGEIIKKEYDPLYPKWNSITNQSNTSTKSCNPYVNPKSYTDNLKLVWQEEVALNSYRIYLDGARFAYDNTETDKRYPKIKDKILTYIEDGNKLVVCPKLIDSLYANIEINSADSIFNPEIAMYTTTGTQTKIYVRSVYTVKKDDHYRIETSYDRVFAEDFASAIIGNEITLTTPTLITTTSYLKDYLPSGEKQKVERVSGTYNGLNKYKGYIVELKTTNNNKNQPYVVVVDGEVEVVIYGKENTTQIRIDRTDYAEDKKIEIYLDRVVGSPNRTVEMKVYEFDKIESEINNAGAGNIKLFKAGKETEDIDCGIKVDKINSKQIVFNIMTDRDDEVTVKLIDITGRVVNIPIKKQVKSGTNSIVIETDRMSSGIYFYAVEGAGMKQTGKVTVIK